MPPRKPGQIYTYPQRHWKKKRYQYLKFFLAPKRSAFDPESEMHTISQIENPTLNEDSNHSMSGEPMSQKEDQQRMVVKTVSWPKQSLHALFYPKIKCATTFFPWNPSRHWFHALFYPKIKCANTFFYRGIHRGTDFMLYFFPKLIVAPLLLFLGILPRIYLCLALLHPNFKCAMASPFFFTQYYCLLFKHRFQSLDIL